MKLLASRHADLCITPHTAKTYFYRRLSYPYRNADALSHVSGSVFLNRSAYDQMTELTTYISVPQQGLGKDHTVNTQWIRVTGQRVTRQPREERKHSDRCQEPKGSIYLCSANKRLYLASRQVSKHGCVGSHLQRNFNFCFSVISFSPSRSGDRPVGVWSVWCWEKPWNDTST